MARMIRDTRLESREARLKLKERKDREPYWRLIHKGLYLGYRKGAGNGVWYVRFRNNKRYIRKTIGQADDSQDSNGHNIFSFREAQGIALKYTAPHLITKNMTVKQAAERYLTWYKENRKSYRNAWLAIQTHIIPAFGHKLIADLKAQEIREWHEKLGLMPHAQRSQKDEDDAKRARKATANRYLTYLKALLNKAYQDELATDDSAWRRVKPFKNVDEPRIRFLKEDEAQRLVNACQPDFRSLVKGALFTGARYGELTRMKVQDIDLDTRKIYITPSKSGKGRHVPLNDHGLDLFKGLVMGKTGNMNVFLRSDGKVWGKDYQNRPIKEACKHARIEPAIGFHDLRHTYGSLLAQKGTPLLNISKLLGHADTRITSRHYAHLCDQVLADTVEKSLPDFGHVIEAGKISNMRVRK